MLKIMLSHHLTLNSHPTLSLSLTLILLVIYFLSMKSEYNGVSIKTLHDVA